MSQGSKVLLGIWTFLPLMLGVALVFYYFTILFGSLHMLSYDENANAAREMLIARLFSGKLLVLIMLLIITKISLIIYYIVHVVNHGREGEKVMWILLFILLGSIPFIIYYFVKIVPMPQRQVGGAGTV